MHQVCRAILHITVHIVHMSVLTHITVCFCISLWCLLSSLSVLRWKSIRMCGRLMAPLSGITLTTQATHSLPYTLSNSYRMVRAPRLRSHWLPHRRQNSIAPSGSMSSPQFPHSTISSQVLAGPTRNVTGEVMPLPEAVAQLSIFEFLQRCGLLIAPVQPPQLPLTISLLDAAVQTLPLCSTSLLVISGRGCAVASTQRRISRCFHTTTVHGVLHRVHLLQRPFQLPSFVIGALQCWQRLTATTC